MHGVFCWLRLCSVSFSGAPHGHCSGSYIPLAICWAWDAIFVITVAALDSILCPDLLACEPSEQEGFVLALPFCISPSWPFRTRLLQSECHSRVGSPCLPFDPAMCRPQRVKAFPADPHRCSPLWSHTPDCPSNPGHHRLWPELLACIRCCSVHTAGTPSALVLQLFCLCSWCFRVGFRDGMTSMGSLLCSVSDSRSPASLSSL